MSRPKSQRRCHCTVRCIPTSMHQCQMAELPPKHAIRVLDVITLFRCVQVAINLKVALSWLDKISVCDHLTLVSNRHTQGVLK